ncbi:MAG: hypothetical protein IKP86_13360 [Anaerolineaceae bacterium]|nr:hypothetical protein [Anaerolineaceae bacterium]
MSGDAHTVNLHTIVQDPNPRGWANGRNLSMYGIMIDELNVMPESPYAEAPELNLTDAYIDLLTTSGPADLTKYLPADLKEDSRFRTNVGTMVLNTDKQITIQSEGVRIGNLVVTGNNRNPDGGAAVTDKKVGLFDNIVLLGCNLTFTNYEKRPGKPAIGTLYVSNRGLDYEEIIDIIKSSGDPLQELLEENGRKAVEDVQVPYYITLNYTNIDNVRYSAGIPEPNLVKNNDTVLLGTIEAF